MNHTQTLIDFISNQSATNLKSTEFNDLQIKLKQRLLSEQLNIKALIAHFWQYYMFECFSQQSYSIGIRLIENHFDALPTEELLPHYINTQ